MKSILPWISLLIFLLPPIIASAQKKDSGLTLIASERMVANPKPKADTTVREVKSSSSFPVARYYRTREEQFLTILLLIFGTIVLALAALLIYKNKDDVHHLFKYFIIILVIIGVILLIHVGYDKEQITPAVGLFGTIAGYLLGKADSTGKGTGNTSNGGRSNK